MEKIMKKGKKMLNVFVSDFPLKLEFSSKLASLYIFININNGAKFILHNLSIALKK